jgi:Tfp pilus assembly protein PilF
VVSEVPLGTRRSFNIMPVRRLALASVRSRQRGTLLNLVVIAISLLGSMSGCGGTEKAPPDAAQRFIEAQEAIARGDNTAALASLQASIESEPNVWAYKERAIINAKQGTDAAVEEDLQAILKLDSDNVDVAWIRAELKKPAANRFQGAAAKAPSSSK